MSAMPWPASNDVTNGVYSNEYIEYCARRYESLCLAVRGITFAQYVAIPSRYDNFDTALEALPLMGRQLRIRNQLLAAEIAEQERRAEKPVEHLPRRDGRITESLHHKRYPKSLSMFIPRSERR